MESKKDIRKQILNQRMQLSSVEWEEKSNRIYQRVISHSSFLFADAVYCYVDFRNEVCTRQIIQAAWNANKKVAVPRIEEQRMNFYYIKQFDELHPGTFGVMEPHANHPACDQNVLVIMPGSVYDKQGHRIGYGGGYYDTYLNEHPHYKTLAVAFEFQILNQIPTEPHDVIPNTIITEENIYDF